MKNGNLIIEDLHFSYPTWPGLEAREVLSGLCMNAAPGELLVVFGGAESGKSTLALITAALVPLHTGGNISGKVFIDEINVSKTSPSDLIEHCGIIFQDPEKQTITTECFSEAAFSLESLGLPVSDINSRLEKAFTRLGIKKLIDREMGETSGGEKKRVALAGLIAMDPDILILDDTMEELDNPSRIELFNLLKKSGRTVIIFSSKYYDVFSNADGFYLLNEGIMSKRETGPFSRNFRTQLKSLGVIPDFGMKSRNRESSVKSGGKHTDCLVKVSDLTYTYDNGGFELRIDEFNLYNGEIISIVGRNGCGKSTLARLLCGLFTPSEGSISINVDGEMKNAEAMVLNSFCAYMFQNPDYQIFLPTVADELGWGLREAGCNPEVVKARVSAAIDLFRLPGGKTPPALMSFSARKRLQAAVYYLLARPVFILDEADTGMSFNDFIDLTGKIREISRSLIVITHNLELAAAVSDRVIGMSGGRMYHGLLNFTPDKLNEWITESDNSGALR